MKELLKLFLDMPVKIAAHVVWLIVAIVCTPPGWIGMFMMTICIVIIMLVGKHC